jgi:hypothetical protein
MEMIVLIDAQVFHWFSTFKEGRESLEDEPHSGHPVKSKVIPVLWEVEAPTFSDIRFIDGGKVVSPMRRLLFTPRKIPGTLFC